MLVYLLRHGIAESNAETDEARELTGEGILQTQSVAEKFKRYSPDLDKAIVSPYRRARQTAASVQVVFPELQFDVDNGIQPDGDIYTVMNTIEKFDVQQILLVSHNPLLSNLLAIMVDGTLNTNRYMGNSMLVCISTDIMGPGCGELLFSIEP